MRILNRKYRCVDKSTDVLSFPQDEDFRWRCKKGFQVKLSKFDNKTSLILGDIVINLHQAKKQAKDDSLTFNEELKRLLVHGLLHLIGYDHERGLDDERKMKRKEKELLTKL